VAYCAASDLYDFGVPRGAAPNPGRLVSSVDATADTLALDVHGLDADSPVVFRAEAGGTMPAPLVAGTTYYAIPVSEYAFQVAASPGGSAIDITTAGERVIAITPLPVAAAIAYASRVIDEHLPAHAVPLADPVPEIVKITAAEIAAVKLVGTRGATGKSLAETIDAAYKRLDSWLRGQPIRGANVPPRTNLATSATAPFADVRGWSRFGGTE
jgi:hypothetical protein